MRSWISLASSCLVVGALGLVAAPAFAQGTAVTQALDVEKKAAQKAYMDGVADYKAGRLESAMARFQQSYDTVASPNSHLMVANTLFDLGRYDEAYVHAEQTAQEGEALGGTYLGSATAARELLTKVRPLVGFVTVNVPAGTKGTLRLDGKDVPEARWNKPLPVMRGAHELVLETAQGAQNSRFELAAGGETTVSLAPPAAPAPPAAAASASSDGLFGFLESEPPMRLAGYGAAGVGVLGLVGFAVLGSLNNAKFSDLEEQCQSGTCPAGASEDVSSGKSLQTGANVMAVIGIVGVAAGATLITLSYTMEDTPADATKRSAAKAPAKAPAKAREVSVGVGLGSVDVRGSF
jgi:hypothetical protein